MNLFDVEGERRFGEELGAKLWGGTVYELAPGTRLAEYHWHFGEEEWLLVLAGSPTLRTPEGERVLEPWDVAVFVTGEAGAHEVRNDGGVAARFPRARLLVVSQAGHTAHLDQPDTFVSEVKKLT